MWYNYDRIYRENDKKGGILDSIASSVDAKSIKDSFSLNRTQAQYPTFACEVLDDVGYYTINLGKTRCHIYQLVVRGDLHGRGYSRVLLERIFSRCKEKGLKLITLSTRIGEPANSFWKHVGAKTVGTKRYTDGTEVYEMEMLLDDDGIPIPPETNPPKQLELQF